MIRTGLHRRGKNARPSLGRSGSAPSRWLRTGALMTMALAFTIALTYVTIELPRWLAALVERWITIPGYDRAIETDEVRQLGPLGWRGWEAISRFIEGHHLHLIGVACLLVVGAMIVGGLVLGRRHVATAGAVALFVPVFGSFAGSMFFLAGIGILRVLWLPAWGTAVMALGDIAYLPYMLIVWPLWLAGVDARLAVAYAAIAVGLLIFVVAAGTWLLARLEGRTIADFWIYRHSRHPQYLGWMVWSWGMMLVAALQPMPHGGLNPGGALAWWLSTLVIVCVAWSEELQMQRDHGAGYVEYRDRTPFLVPLPAKAARLLTAPVRLLTGRAQPQRRVQIVAAAAAYLAGVFLLSLPFAMADWPPLDWWAWPDAASAGAIGS